MRVFTLTNSFWLVLSVLFGVKFQITKSQCWTGKIQKGKRCTDVFRTANVASRKKCLASCLQTIGCCSVNYNKDQKLCEMCTITENTTLEDNPTFSYIGEVDIVKNCGVSANNFLSPCVPCLGPVPILHKAEANVNLSTGYPVFQYTCTDGYIPNGGTDTSTCDTQRKQWTVPSMICQVPCVVNPPPIAAHATSTFNSSVSEVVYSCIRGYLFAGGSKTSKCNVTSKEWSTPSILCPVCFENKYTFNESVSVLLDNGHCGRWDNQTSEYKHFPDSYFEADQQSKENASNYCRHPRLTGTDKENHEAPSPYCESADPYIQKRMCAIANCNSKDLEECGDPPTIVSSQVKRLDPIAGDVFLTRFQCLNYSGGSSTPHCPVSRCNDTNSWTAPSVSCTASDCIASGNFLHYNGKRFCTESGRICQSWMLDEPHYNAYRGFREPSNSNYCRSTNGYHKPWCYTTDPGLRWEYCAVPNC